MGESYVGIVEERRLIREEALRVARSFAERVRSCFGRATILVIGSYARGDFNEWSDVDLLIILENAPKSPLERMDNIISRCPPPAGVEPIVLTIDEFETQKKRNTPLFQEACHKGIVLVDELGVFAEERGCESLKRSGS